MTNEHYSFAIKDDDSASAGRSAAALADDLQARDGVIEAVRGKGDDPTMDLGTIVQVIAGSGATLALAQGVSAWLKARRSATVTITRSSKSGSVKVAATGIDPATAERIIELELP